MATSTGHRLFPILGERTGSPKTYIPWALIAPHEGQALRNHTQTLERLAQRGGLDPTEAVAVLEGRDWVLMPYQEAHVRLAEILAQRTIVPPHADMIYMPVPRCEFCKHWTRGTIPVVASPSHGGTCANPELAVWNGEQQTIETSEAFGCVQWEARP